MSEYVNSNTLCNFLYSGYPGLLLEGRGNSNMPLNIIILDFVWQYMWWVSIWTVSLVSTLHGRCSQSKTYCLSLRCEDVYICYEGLYCSYWKYWIRFSLIWCDTALVLDSQTWDHMDEVLIHGMSLSTIRLYNRSLWRCCIWGRSINHNMLL